MLFSIIIPTYNRADFLPRAITSVMSQMLEDWELVIVDDGSTDNTKETVLPFLKDSRISYHYQENAERSAARNKGISLAKGDFVCFMDSDEYMLKEHLENLNKAISALDNQVGVYVFNIGFDYVFDSSKNYTRRAIPFQNPINPNQLIDVIIGAPQLCLHRQVFEKEVFNVDLVVGEDTELLFRFSHWFPFFYIDEKPTLFELEHENRSVANKSLSAEKQLKTLKVMFSGNHPANRVSVNKKRWLLSEVYLIASIDYLYDMRLNGLSYLLLSLWKNPSSNKTKYKLNLLIRFLLGQKNNLQKLLKQE